MDLTYENTLVKPIKNIGQRNPNAAAQLMARGNTKFYIRVKEVEERAGSFEFGPIQPQWREKMREESRKLCNIVKAWAHVVRIVCAASSTKGSPNNDQFLGTESHFANKYRTYCRLVHGVDHASDAATIFVKGYLQGIDPQVPPRKQTCLVKLHRKKSNTPTRSKSKKISSKAERVSNNAQTFLQSDECVILPPTSQIFGPINKRCGKKKSVIVQNIINEMKDNASFISEPDQIGSGPSLLVLLARNKYEAADRLQKMAARPGSARGRRPISKSLILQRTCTSTFLTEEMEGTRTVWWRLHMMF